MKIRNIFQNKSIKRGIITGALLSVGALGLFAFGSASANTTVTGPRDCDSGSVIYCGALSTEELNTKFTQNSYGDLPGIFNHFGISASEVSGLNNNVTIGEVRADGTVWAAGKLIGVNALTAGRTRTTNSVAIPGTNAYTRPPSDSFATPSTRISIFIGSTTDAKPWAVITSCGNPLTWDKPDIDIEKTVAKKGESSFSENVAVDHNGKATFKLTVSETSNKVAVTNVVVKDTLPNGLTFVNGSVMVDGVSKPDLTPSNIPLGTMAKGQKIVITFDVVAKLIEKECGNEKMVNKASVTADMQKPKEDDASVNVKKLCEVYACEDLSGPSILKRGQTASYTAKASAENTTVKEYVFSEDCKLQVKVSEDKCPVPGKENLPVDSPDCYEPCPIPGKENLRKDSPDCAEVKAVVTTIPNTGAGGIAGLLGSVTVAGAALHRRFTLKRR
jgi:uncharacterized repeat protein (TIGR01451 family)